MEIRSATGLAATSVNRQTPDKKAEERQAEQRTEEALKSAVNANDSASVEIRKVEAQLSNAQEAEVARANQESSKTEVRDVEQATNMANDLTQAIAKNPDEAVSAQANQNPNRAEQLLA